MKQIKHSLGTIESRLLSTLSSTDKTIFTVEDAKNVTGSSMPATRIILSKLVKKRWLISLSSGKYLIVPLSAGEKGEHTENWYLIAKNLVNPSTYYISYFSALEIHEITTQPIFRIYISTPNRKRPKDILGANFQFVYTRGKDMWGLEDNWVTPSQKVKVSDLERTIIDCLDRLEFCGGVTEVAKAIWNKRNDFDFEKLLQYLIRFNRKSVVKRLGFLLDIYGIANKEVLTELKKLLSPSYAKLDSTLEDTGRFLSSWKLRINISQNELLDITKT